MDAHTEEEIREYFQHPTAGEHTSLEMVFQVFQEATKQHSHSFVL